MIINILKPISSMKKKVHIVNIISSVYYIYVFIHLFVQTARSHKKKKKLMKSKLVSNN